MCSGHDVEAARRQSDALQGVSDKGLPVVAWADSLIKWMPDEVSQSESILQQTQQGNESFRAQGTGIGNGAHLLHLAEGFAKAGQMSAAMTTINEVLAWIDQSGAHMLEAEATRMKGELLLMEVAKEEGAKNAAEAQFRAAIAIARQQKARWWELRATVSLCRLYVTRNIPDDSLCNDACRMLAEICNGFSEGADMLDLQGARQLLKEMQRAP